MPPADVISVDLPWGDKPGRTAVARRDPSGVAVETVADNDQLLAHVVDHAAPSALVLLDIPLDGCDDLSATKAFRDLDRRLLKAGIPILPSKNARQRGPQLRERIVDARPDLTIGEIFPYAILRVLWALDLSGHSLRFDDAADEIDVSTVWWTWPPKYKREKTVAKRRDAMVKVGELLARVPGFARAVRSPGSMSTSQLAALSDEYDALLGLVAGMAAVDKSSWAWTASVPGHDGRLMSIADGWLRRRFRAVSR